MIVTKEGKRLGFVKDIIFETSSGELINIVVKDSTPYTKNLNLEKSSANELLVPFNSSENFSIYILSKLNPIIFIMNFIKEVYLNILC